VEASVGRVVGCGAGVAAGAQAASKKANVKKINVNFRNMVNLHEF
jgi:hypothetical protein